MAAALVGRVTAQQDNADIERHRLPFSVWRTLSGIGSSKEHRKNGGWNIFCRQRTKVPLQPERHRVSQLPLRQQQMFLYIAGDLPFFAESSRFSNATSCHRALGDASSRLWKGPSAGTLSSSAHHASSQPAEAQKTVTGETDAAHAGPSNFFKHRCDSFKGSRQTLRGHPSPFIMPATRVAGEAGAPHVAPPKLLRTPPRLVAEQSSK
ncbi:hypothetical protein JOL62DRAFT_560056 [Phyllosticta paracitricarpa]|uniref:Uncharacterized protein n=1 Tax=Phyllosticta paracitricarpa TaxID=2016321 RepID=A0ABR1MVM3_9PEZI